MGRREHALEAEAERAGGPAPRLAPWSTERSLSYARWAGAVVAVMQALLFEPGPQARPYLIPATFALAGLFGLTNLAILPALRRRRVTQRLAASVFGVDLGVVCTIVWLYLDNPNATQWVLFMIVQLEAAYRWELPGALGTAVFSGIFYGIVRFTAAQEFGFPFTIDSVTYVLGLTLVQALVVGWMARKLRSERDTSLQLHEAALSLNAGLEEHSVLSRLSTEATRLMGAELVVVWIRRGDEFVPAASAHLPPGTEQTLRLSASDPMFGEPTVATAYRTGEVVWAPDPAGQRSSPTLEASVLPSGWRSAWSAPIAADGGALGVLSCYRSTARGPFPEETARMQALASLTAVAMQNAAAYDRERSAVDQLRTVDTLKDDFLSTVSHELRTPLTVVEGFSATLSTRWDEMDEKHRRDLVRRIESQARELHERIGDLLDFSRLRSREFRFRLQPQHVELRQLTEEVLGLLEPTLAPHRVELDIAEGASAWIDPTAYQQILENLLVNAARYSPAHEPVVVEAKPLDEGEWTLVAVSDGGIGIPSDELEKIFERFYRGQQADVRKVRGTGIGLAIVKELTEASGGRVGVQSSLGNGSTFTLHLPATKSSAPDTSPDLGQPTIEEKDARLETRSGAPTQNTTPPSED